MDRLLAKSPRPRWQQPGRLLSKPSERRPQIFIAPVQGMDLPGYYPDVN
jgi:hypothetical protein